MLDITPKQELIAERVVALIAPTYRRERFIRDYSAHLNFAARVEGRIDGYDPWHVYEQMRAAVACRGEAFRAQDEIDAIKREIEAMEAGR